MADETFSALDSEFCNWDYVALRYDNICINFDINIKTMATLRSLLNFKLNKLSSLRGAYELISENYIT